MDRSLAPYGLDEIIYIDRHYINDLLPVSKKEGAPVSVIWSMTTTTTTTFLVSFLLLLDDLFATVRIFLIKNGHIVFVGPVVDDMSQNEDIAFR